jgi:hypothetical protein
MGHGIGPGEGLIEPAVILPAVELNVIGRTEILGRPAHRLRAAPVGDGDWDGSFALHALGSSADEYELLADAERGILLRSEARLGGEPFRVLEITELALDDELSPGTFTLEPPEGETFEDFEPFRHTTLDQLPRLVPFTVFVPERPPGPAPHVSIQNPDRRRATPLSVMLSYMVPKANGEFGNLWIHESREAPELPSGGAEGWRQVSGVLVHEDDSMGYLRCKVRLVRDGTHIELESTAIATHELLVLAQSLVPLPPDPPGLVSVDPGA